MEHYNTLHEVIRDGMELRVECRKCRHVQRVDPEDLINYVADMRRADAMLSSYRLQPIPHANPDLILQGRLDELPCRICKAGDWKVDAIKPLNTDDDESE